MKVLNFSNRASSIFLALSLILLASCGDGKNKEQTPENHEVLPKAGVKKQDKIELITSDNDSNGKKKTHSDSSQDDGADDTKCKAVGDSCNSSEDDTSKLICHNKKCVENCVISNGQCSDPKQQCNIVSDNNGYCEDKPCSGVTDTKGCGDTKKCTFKYLFNEFQNNFGGRFGSSSTSMLFFNTFECKDATATIPLGDNCLKGPTLQYLINGNETCPVKSFCSISLQEPSKGYICQQSCSAKDQECPKGKKCLYSEDDSLSKLISTEFFAEKGMGVCIDETKVCNPLSSTPQCSPSTEECVPVTKYSGFCSEKKGTVDEGKKCILNSAQENETCGINLDCMPLNDVEGFCRPQCGDYDDNVSPKLGVETCVFNSHSSYDFRAASGVKVTYCDPLDPQKTQCPQGNNCFLTEDGKGLCVPDTSIQKGGVKKGDDCVVGSLNDNDRCEQGLFCDPTGRTSGKGVCEPLCKDNDGCGSGYFCQKYFADDFGFCRQECDHTKANNNGCTQDGRKTCDLAFNVTNADAELETKYYCSVSGTLQKGDKCHDYTVISNGAQSYSVIPATDALCAPGLSCYTDANRLSSESIKEKADKQKVYDGTCKPACDVFNPDSSQCAQDEYCALRADGVINGYMNSNGVCLKKTGQVPSTKEAGLRDKCKLKQESVGDDSYSYYPACEGDEHSFCLPIDGGDGYCFQYCDLNVQEPCSDGAKCIALGELLSSRYPLVKGNRLGVCR